MLGRRLEIAFFLLAKLYQNLFNESIRHVRKEEQD